MPVGTYPISVNPVTGVLGYDSMAFVRRTADRADITSNTTLADDGVLQLDVAASGVYFVRAMIHYTADANGDLKIGFTAPAAATFTWTPISLTTTATTSAAALRMPTKAIADSDIAGGVDSSTSVAAFPTGLLVVGATAGTFKLQVAQGTSSATATVVKAGSWMFAERVA